MQCSVQVEISPQHAPEKNTGFEDPEVGVLGVRVGVHPGVKCARVPPYSKVGVAPAEVCDGDEVVVVLSIDGVLVAVLAAAVVSYEVVIV
jgi:hypothetical protein